MTDYSYLDGFYPEQQRLIELAERGMKNWALPPPEEMPMEERYKLLSRHIADCLRGLLVSIGSRLDETGAVIVTPTGLTKEFANACFSRVPLFMEDQPEASLLLKTEFMRYAATPNLSLPRTRLSLDDQGNVRVHGIPHTREPLLPPSEPWEKARAIKPGDLKPKT